MIGQIVLWVYLVGAVLVTLGFFIMFTLDRKNSGLPWFVNIAFSLIAGISWPVGVWLLFQAWLGFPFDPPVDPVVTAYRKKPEDHW